MPTPSLALRDFNDRSVLVTEQPLSLPQWLEVSWFYPEGFKREQVIETARSWVVLGNGIVYKFLKLDQTSEEDPRKLFTRKWQAACEEIVDNQKWAPDLYLGLRLLRLSEDEPEWTSLYLPKDLNSKNIPQGDDVAIIMRRVEEHNKLPNIANRSATQSEKALSLFSERIVEVHRESLNQKNVIYPGLTARLLQKRYLDGLEIFVRDEASFLDPFTRLALNEVAFYLKSFLEQHEREICARAAINSVTDCHGALRADRIASLALPLSQPAVNICGRLTRTHTSRNNDVLSDVAALSADLHARGFSLLAESFEQQYFAKLPEVFDVEFLRFFKVAESANRAWLSLSGNVEDKHALATRYLAYSLRTAYGLNKPVLFVLSGDDSLACQNVARAIDELVGGHIVDATTKIEAAVKHASPLATASSSLDKLLNSAATRVKMGQSISLIHPYNRAADREQIESFAKKYQLPTLYLYIELSEADNLSLRQRSLAERSAYTTQQHVVPPLARGLINKSNSAKGYCPTVLSLSAELPMMICELSIPPAELALNALRTLKRQVNSPAVN